MTYCSVPLEAPVPVEELDLRALGARTGSRDQARGLQEYGVRRIVLSIAGLVGAVAACAAVGSLSFRHGGAVLRGGVEDKAGVGVVSQKDESMRQAHLKPAPWLEVAGDGADEAPCGDGEEKPCSPSLANISASVKAAEDMSSNVQKCKQYAGGCDWTAVWSCPGQRHGTMGQGSDDDSVPWLCCCTMEKWRELPGVLGHPAVKAEMWRILESAGEAEVRQTAASTAPLLDRRAACTVLKVYPQGGWLKIAEEPGYVQASSATKVPGYRNVESGGCLGAGMHQIIDHDECVVAGKALGVNFVYDETHRRCSWLDGMDGARQIWRALCRDAPAAPEPCRAPAAAAAASSAPATNATSRSRMSDGPSLFCFSVVQAKGYERPLVLELLKQAVGIFACDSFALLSQTDSFKLGRAPKVLGGAEVWTHTFKAAHVGVSKDNTAGNTKLFMNAWNTVRDLGQWREADFTVKADPDAVLIPDRLRRHMSAYASWGAVFVKNCNKVPTDANFPMMFGALEVFSRAALQAYFDRQEECATQLPWHPWGEDFFMGKCLDKLGVAGLPDFTLLGDNLCTGARCTDGLMAAYHPFKDIRAWYDCWGQAHIAKEPETYEPVPRPATVHITG